MASKVQKISIALPKQMVADIRYAVDRGDYASTSEVVREALREWKGKQRELPQRVRVPKTREEFLRRIEKAKTSAARGDVKPAEEVFARLEAKYKAAMDKQKPAGKRRI